MKFLGHVILADGVVVSPAKVEVILDWQPITTLSELWSFLDLVGYYRIFIRDFSKISIPLTNLTKKNVAFIWDKKCYIAFDMLRQCLLTTLVLIIPNGD